MPGPDSRYFRYARREIAPLLPEAARLVLDVGCGSGGVSRGLRARYPDARFVGLEGNPAMAAELTENMDTFHITDLNQPAPDVGQPDLILCLDILEHLLRPEAVLADLVGRLAPGGTVVVSVPNIASFRVAAPLFLSGRFEYADAGILDRTHLRFFTRASTLALMEGAGLAVHAALRTGLTRKSARLLDLLTLGQARDRLATQIIAAGRRAAPGAPRPAVTWFTDRDI